MRPSHVDCPHGRRMRGICWRDMWNESRDRRILTEMEQDLSRHETQSRTDQRVRAPIWNVLPSVRSVTMAFVGGLAALWALASLVRG